ncbi:MMPL family transporter [Jeotgalibacillus soli]|uniref:Membrane protein n=1 Tax=Jeotgalibacillus soli TaxID=889306 RepID=A0A0C2V8P8_9BACL|nr:MMPL family transporter [Jeotgalibacillus soli]KIL45337.1 membrane protein [Jeotgalibacillus soli]
MKKLASWIISYHKSFLVLWTIIFLALGYFAIHLPAALEGDGFHTEGEYEEVQHELVETFDFPSDTLLVLFEQQTSQDDASYVQEISDVLNAIDSLQVTSAIQSPLDDEMLRQNGIAYSVLHFTDESLDLADVVAEIRAITDNSSEIEITVTGQPVISEDINKASQQDLARAELIGVPIALLILLLAFGTIVSALVPIMIGIVTVVSSFGILTLMGGSLDLSIFLLNVVPMIGLALSIDFALLFINRYREELRQQDKSGAIITTIETAGRSIIFSAICVFIGLGAMMVIQVDIFQTIAIGGMVVIAIAVLASLTLLPSILFVLGPKLNKWRIIKVSKERNENSWRRFAHQVMKQPVIISLAALIILGIGIIPVKDMQLAIPGVDALPESFDSRLAYEKIEDTFLTEGGSESYIIAERSGKWLSGEGLTEMKRLEGYFSSEKAVRSVQTLFGAGQIETPQELLFALNQPQTAEALQPAVDAFIQGEKLLIPVTLNLDPDSVEAQQLMRDWSTADWGDSSLHFGGPAKFNQEIFDEIYSKVGISIGIILISTYLILLVAFRSILIPLKAIIMNVIGLASTFGILVWLFQGGHFGLTETDIALVLPVLVFSLVFGLSMDYEVFLISRIQEYYEKTGDNHYATVEGLASTSKIITSAALIMIAITGAFAFTGVMPVKQIGIGIALAILIDATIIRLLLVPSLMKLFGSWNWWLPFGLHKKKKPSWLQH